MSQYTNVGGVARKVTKRYENIGGVAKNILKAYDNVNGVARQYFTGGIPWRKWSCNYSAASDPWYVEGESSGVYQVGYTATSNWGGSTWYGYEDYEFSGDEGFIGIGGGTVPIEDMPNYYMVDTTRVTIVTNMERVDSDTYEVTWEVIAVCQGYYYPASYDKGSTDYGIVYAPEGDLPEEGTLVKGSTADNYCVVEVDGTYYYYEKVEQ